MSKAVWTKPQVFDHCGDTSKQWFIYFRYTNPLTRVRKQFRFKKGINYFHSAEDRRREANILKRELLELLKQGWNLFSNEHQKPKELGELCAEMYAIKEKTLRKESKRTYIYKYRHFISWLEVQGYQRWVPGDFAVRQAYEYLDHYANCGFTGRHYNYHRAIASMLFEMMQDRQIIAANPFTKTTRQAVPEGSSTVFTPRSTATIQPCGMCTSSMLFPFILIRNIDGDIPMNSSGVISCSR